MKYFVTVAGVTREIVIDGDVVTVDGVARRASLARVAGTPEIRVTIDGVTSGAAVDGFIDGMWRVNHRGTIVDVEAVDERTRHIRSLGGAARAAAGGGVLKAPMPGLVMKIAAAEGDRVAAGQGLVVLEAMKMENELKAPAAGTIKAVRVTVGQAVEKGQVLLELGEE